MTEDPAEDTSDFDFEAARVRDAELKEKGKQYIDKKRSAEFSGIQSGDKVLVKQQQSNKLDLPFSPSIHTVIKRHGHEAFVQSEEGKIRDIAHLKKYHDELPSTHLKMTTKSQSRSQRLPATNRQRQTTPTHDNKNSRHSLMNNQLVSQ